MDVSGVQGDGEDRVRRTDGTSIENRKSSTQQSATSNGGAFGVTKRQADAIRSVLFVTRCFPPTTGGMERFASDLHQAVSEKTDITLLSWGGSKKALIFVLPYFFVRSFWLLLTKRIDVIHAQDGVVSIVCMPLKWIFKKPVVVVIHGLDVTYKNSLYQRLIRWSLSRADAVACISGAAKAEVISRGITEAKVRVIPVGITDDLFIDNKQLARQKASEFVPGLQPKTKLLLTSGRLVERKGVDWFVANVMPKLVEKHPEVLLAVSGEGAWRPQVEAAIENNGMAGNVIMLGRTSDEQLKLLYNAADCFVMPNVIVPGDMEGFGRVLLEAALCKVPVVASGIEGIVDAIIDGKNGTLVQEREASEFIRVILEVIETPKLAQKQGKDARTYTLDHYGWPTIAEQYLKVYTKIQKVQP